MPRISGATNDPVRNGSSPSVSASRPHSDVRRMLIVGAASSVSPFPPASAPSACPYALATVRSHEAAIVSASGNAVTPVLASPIPFGPSMNRSGGMPSLGTPELPLATRASFSAAVIAASTMDARRAAPSFVLHQGWAPHDPAARAAEGMKRANEATARTTARGFIRIHRDMTTHNLPTLGNSLMRRLDRTGRAV